MADPAIHKVRRDFAPASDSASATNLDASAAATAAAAAAVAEALAPTSTPALAVSSASTSAPALSTENLTEEELAGKREYEELCRKLGVHSDDEEVRLLACNGCGTQLETADGRPLITSVGCDMLDCGRNFCRICLGYHSGSSWQQSIYVTMSSFNCGFCKADVVPNCSFCGRSLAFHAPNKLKLCGPDYLCANRCKACVACEVCSRTCLRSDKGVCE